MSKWVVLGLSGVTNGGKTTLANKLLEVLPASTQVIKQDNYFYLEDDPHHVPCPGGINHHNWDVITGIDMEKMIQDVKEIFNSEPAVTPASTLNEGTEPLTKIKPGPDTRPILVLDGFLLFADPQLTEMCDLRYFLTLSRDQCWERRKERDYDPPDPPEYFDLCVWPMFQEHLKFVEENVKSVTILDGSIDHFPQVLQKVLTVAGLKPPLDHHNGNSGSCAYI